MAFSNKSLEKYPMPSSKHEETPPFIVKVWNLLEDSSMDHLINWHPSGTSFHVFDQQRFSREVLPQYFKHSNIASFIRQLNMYGFRKVSHIDQGGLKLEMDDLHFQHPYFQRGEKEMLQHIKRKVSNQAVRADTMTTVKSDEVSRVLTDVNQIKTKQQDAEDNMEYIKRENKLLWREIATLRQKHNKQQEIVNKLIQFLVSLVSSNRTGLTIPQLRRAPLAIDSNQPVSPSPVTVDKNSSLADSLVAGIPPSYTVESPQSIKSNVMAIATPPTGPIIQEVTVDTNSDLGLDSSLAPMIPSSPQTQEAAFMPDVKVISANNTPVLLVKAEGRNCYLAQTPPTTTNIATPAVQPSPNIEEVPSLQDALVFDWTSPSDITIPSSPDNSFSTSPQSLLLSPSQGRSASSQKRKRSKPADGLSVPESSPTKRFGQAGPSSLSSTSSTTASPSASASLLTPNIKFVDQTQSPLEQLVLSNSVANKDDGDDNAKAVIGAGAAGDDSLALSASHSSSGDDFSLNSNQLDFLNSDLDGLRGLLQDQYKLDPSILMDLFDPHSPLSIFPEKSEEERAKEERLQASTSDESIIGNEMVQYNRRELFPDLLEDGLIGDIDDID